MTTSAVSQRIPNKRQVVGTRQAARTSSRSKKGGGGFVSIASTMTNLVLLATPAILTKRLEAASTDVMGRAERNILAAGVATNMDPNHKESRMSNRSRLSSGAKKISRNAASLISILYLFSIIFMRPIAIIQKEQSVMIEELPIKEHDDKTMSPLILGCSEIGQLPIIDIIGKGKQKISYKIQLPSGEHAVAKRCISLKCVKESLVEKEATILKHLQEQNGRHQTLEVFGLCEGSKWRPPHLNEEDIEKSANDFTIGYTSIIALAEPLLSEWKQAISYGKRRKCFASHFTDEDIEGFRTIARQYANYSKYPLTLESPGKNMKYGSKSDNRYAENYLLTKAGIRHGDLDSLYPCEKCSYEEALQINCKSVNWVAKISSLNCSTSLPNETLQIKDGHINHTKAETYCWGLKKMELRAQY